MNTGSAILVFLGQGLCCFAIPAVIITLILSGVIQFRSPFRINRQRSAQQAADRAAIRTIVQRDKQPEDRIGIGRQS